MVFANKMRNLSMPHNFAGTKVDKIWTKGLFNAFPSLLPELESIEDI